ncbi:MAG: hypothetical protein DMG12_08290 [Acidobacteria bacterium]|nr:MAG: hypothetical protein DMG12_08290 [Acidobacteriota bacterium]
MNGTGRDFRALGHSAAQIMIFIDWKFPFWSRERQYTLGCLLRQCSPVRTPGPAGCDEESRGIIDAGSLFEYACHEGNYGLEGILKGARVEEEKAKRGGSQ